MERMDRRSRFPSRSSDTKPTEPSGSLGNTTEKSSEPLLLRKVSVRLEDCGHKLGPNGVFIVQSLEYLGVVDDSEDDDEDDDDGDGRDTDYIPDGKRFHYRSKRRGRPSLSGKRLRKGQVTSATGGNYSCNQCSKTFSQLNHLKLHERTHSKKASVKSRPRHPARKAKTESSASGSFSCDQCGKAYSQLNHLKLHQRTHKGGQEKDLGKSGSNKCDLCGKVFSSPAYISIHKRIHTGEKRYSCNVCGKAFTQASARTVHQRKHNKGNASSATLSRPQGRKRRTRQTVVGDDDQDAQCAETLETPQDKETREGVENGEAHSSDNAIPQHEDIGE